MKKSFVSVLSLLLPTLLFASGYEFEGVGARQVARCGAVIADSKDWTSIYWNAANIAPAVKSNGPEVGAEVFGGQAFGKDSNSLSSLPGIGSIFDKHELNSSFILGAVGALVPIGEKMGLGFGVYTPLLQGAKFSDKSHTSPQSELDFKASAGIVTTALAFGYQATPALSLGAGVNLLYGHLESDLKATNTLLAGNTATSSRDASGVGLEGVLGLNFTPSPKWAFGAVYRSGSDVGLHGSEKITNSSDSCQMSKVISGTICVIRQPRAAV